MAIHGLAHYNLRLEAGLMEEVCAFYQRVVGLRLGPRPAFRSRGYWLYAGDRDVLHLSEERPQDRRRVGSDLSFDHVAFAASDWEGSRASLLLAEVPFHEDRVPGTGQRQLFFRDPVGNGIELIFPGAPPA